MLRNILLPSFKQLNFKHCLSQVIKFNHLSHRFSDFNVYKMANKPKVMEIRKQNFDYFLVLDFEATCEKDIKIEPQEIIEFPVLKVNGNTFEVESLFHQYVEPTIGKELSPFCTELTGIIQEMVDGQPNLTQVLELLHNWLQKEALLEPNVKFIFVTYGDWDLNVMLPSQCSYFNIPYSDYLKRWINIKKPFADCTGVYPKGMMSSLARLKIPHVGRHHSGIDDCRNIANILKALAQQGKLFVQTGQKKQ